MKKILTSLAISISLLAPTFSYAERIGDISNIKGVRENQLQGFGLVVGLPNTGDRGSFTTSNLMTLIQKYGIKVPESINLSSRNVAAVMINATLPAFAKKGQLIDVTISSLGNAKSLRGGTLLTTPLMGMNGEIFAIGQGQILVDGISAQGLDGSSIDINSSSVGRIPMGATIERELSYASIFSGDKITLNLMNSDFSLSSEVENTINNHLGEGTAQSIDAGSILIQAPKETNDRIEFISIVNNIEVELPKQKAKVVINSRTGTVMISENITLAPVAISEGGVVINISEQQTVSQPNPLGNGTTTVTNNSQVKIEQKQGELRVINSAGTLQDLVQALNSMGTGPKDLANIIQLLKQSGSLRAKVVVI